MLPSSTQALILALQLRGWALSHDTTIAKQKDWMAQTRCRDGSYCYWYNTYREEYFPKVGRKTNGLDALKTKEGDSVHSTFSTNKE